MKPELSPPSSTRNGGSPSDRDARQLCNRHRKCVEGERERLPVEVAGRDDVFLLDQDERVVRRGVELDGDGPLDVVEQVARSAVDLGRAA
jgi:hypothetical protein